MLGPTPVRHSFTSLLRSLLPIWSQSMAEIIPPEPVTFFNDVLGQNVTELLCVKKKKIAKGMKP